MRPSTRLVTLVLIAVALTVAVLLWAPKAAQAVAAGWAVLVLVAVTDLLMATRPRALEADIEFPTHGLVGGSAQMTANIRARKGALPASIAGRLDLDPALEPENEGVLAPVYSPDHAQAKVTTPIRMTQRGRHAVRMLSLKWPSRLGLFEIIADTELDQNIVVAPDISPVLSGVIKAQMLPLTEGQKDMRVRGEGSELFQLRSFMPGMDPRQIDWKRSARMRDLVVRETRAERNHQIILCVDGGHLMIERIAGLPKLDRAINAALAMCWAGGLGGDLVGFYNFDSRPRLFVPPAPGRAAFTRLQTICADLRYEASETNHTLALTHLGSRLKRRSLIIVFSDFVDSTTAELLVENMHALARHHLVLYVALRDPALTRLAEPENVTMDAIASSVSARQILQERRQVIERLTRLGVLCLDTTPENLTTNLVARYIDIKSRERI